MRQYNTSTRNTSMKFDWKYSTFLYSLLVSLPAEGGTWKCAVLKNVPNGLIFALFLANHSFTTGCDMLRGTGTLMPGLLSSLVVCSSISPDSSTSDSVLSCHFVSVPATELKVARTFAEFMGENAAL